MIVKLFIMITLLAFCESVFFRSSFWAPLFDRKILNYRVDAKFDTEVAKNNREEYQEKNGYRGQALIADLGNGKAPDNRSNKDYGDLKFYYTRK